MDQGILDRLMNKLMRVVINMQWLIIKTELFFDKYILHISVVTFILMIIFGHLHYEPVALICSFTLCLLVMLKLSSGWHSSIRKFCAIILFYLIYIILLMGLVVMQIMSISGLKQLLPYLVAVYFVMWVFLSLLARPDVAKLANEILSAVISMIFTVGTYIMGIVLPKHLPSDVIDSMYKTEEALEQAMLRDDQVANVILQSSIYWAMERLFLYLLPFICITIISQTAISIKRYWLKNNPKFVEVWDIINSSESEDDEIIS